MEFLKKQSIGFYTSVIVVVLTIVSAVLFRSNATNGYYNDPNSTVILLAAVGVILVIVSIALAQAADTNPVLDTILALVRVLIPVAIMAAGMVFVTGRVYSYGIIFGSDLEAGNEAAHSAAVESIVAMGFCAGSAVLAAITAFFSIKKAE